MILYIRLFYLIWVEICISMITNVWNLGLMTKMMVLILKKYRQIKVSK